MTKNSYDAVVVGGGHNGLVAACYLVKAGQSVLVLEHNARLGGAAASERIFPGMDAKISRYAYLVSLLPRKIIDDLNLSFRARRRSVASCTPYQSNGREEALIISATNGQTDDESFWRLAGEADWRGYRKFRELQRVFASRVWPSLLQPLRSRAEWEGWMRDPAEREAWNAFVERPLGETVERLIQNDLLRGLLFTDAKIGVFTHPSDETLLQNRCFILHAIGSGTGEWQVPIGGMGALVDELARTARAHGVKIVTSAEALSIEPGDYHRVVYRHEEQEQAAEAKHVLVNAAPSVLGRLLGESAKARTGDEGSVCKVNMLLTHLPRFRARIDSRQGFAGTLHVDESYEQMEVSHREAAKGELPAVPPFEAYCHTLTDDSILSPQLRQDGYQTLTLFGLDAPYRTFAENHDAKKTELQLRYLQDLNRVLAEPIEECLAVDRNRNPCIEVKTPQDLEQELAMPRGNIFHSNPSWFFTDDANQVGAWGVETAVERLYVCGSSAVRGGGVSGIPGHNAAQHVLADLDR